MRVVCHSQHLTGIGHHVRMHCIASALATGHEVHLVEGGRSVPRPRLAAEPERLVVPVLLRDDSGELVGAGGEPGAAVLAERRRVLADAVAVIRPDVVLIDHYPFSKWELTEEIGALTAAARAANPGTRVVCSLRDLVPQTRYEAVGRSAYDAEVLRRLRDDFDAVLVHAEPTWSGLGDTFPAAGEVEPPVRATGYVVEPALSPRPGELPDEPYAVASAGGLEATEFLGAVVAAHARLVATVPGAPARLHVFAPAGAGDDVLARLRAVAREHARADDVVIHPFDERFGVWLDAAALSVSRAGYNTCAASLRGAAATVLVPDPQLSDQPPRAELFARAGAAVAVPSSAATVDDALAAAMAAALHSSAAGAVEPPRTDGAFVTVELLDRLVRGEEPWAPEWREPGG